MTQSSFFHSFILSSLFSTLVPIQGKCTRLVSHLLTFNDAQPAVGLPWTNDEPLAQRPLPDSKHKTHRRETFIPGRNSNPQSQQASGSRPDALDQRSNRDRVIQKVVYKYFSSSIVL